MGFTGKVMRVMRLGLIRFGDGGVGVEVVED